MKPIWHSVSIEKFSRLPPRFSGVMHRCLLFWGAYSGLFFTASACPCCGQSVCPAGAAGMGIVTGLLAAVTGIFRKRRIFQTGTDLIQEANRPLKRKTTSIITAGLLLVLCVLTIQGCAHNSQNLAESRSPNGSFYQGVIEFYRGPLNHLRGVRRGGCPMYPSCSEYSRQAIARFGIAKGWVMSMDRMMRCGRSETRLAQKIWVNGQLKYYDPIEKNIF